MNDYADYDALGLAELVRNKDVSPKELLEAALSRAESAQDELNCFSALFPEIAQDQIAKGLGDGPFAGVPYVTKDLGVEIEGAPITNGCRAFTGHVSQHDSELTKRYRAAGLTLFGQTTSPEFGLTTSTESTMYGLTRNPWNIEHTSGGSSGGASAAVAAGVLPLAQASDGGGSIRIPAACCGLFGLKPSRGRIPMGPTRTEGWNGLSTVHCVSRSVRDSAALMDATHGIEPGARYAAPPPEETYLAACARDPKPLRIAFWDTAPNGTTPDPDAAAGVAATTKLLEELGHTVETASPALNGDALGKGMLMVISAAMAGVAVEREAALGRPVGEQDFEPITLRYIEMGKSIPLVEMAHADAAFMTAAIEFERFMDAGGYDLILAPVLSRAPEKLGVLGLAPADTDAYTQAVTTFAPWCPPFNQTGCPAMSVPLHWTEAGLPLGMMFGGRYGSESLLFSLAGQLERAAPWADRRPPFWVG
ncbi:MAG: amidase [Pseudomonadota bacterium]